ncbi:hypothetical protein H4R20_001756, partial [Coemansia guatemalensis]
MEVDVNKDDDVAQRHVNKVPLVAIGMRHRFAEQLNRHVVDVNLTTTATYMLLKWIFIHELHKPDFKIEEFITQNFFSEVFKYLCHREKKSVSSKTQLWRDVIERYLDEFKVAAGFGDPLLSNAIHVANYEAKTIITAYTNNIVQHFGEHLNRAVNCILGKRQMEQQLRNIPPGPEHDEFRHLCREEVWIPAKQAKSVIGRRDYSDSTLCARAQYVLHLLAPVLDAYDANYKFAEDSHFLDVT